MLHEVKFFRHYKAEREDGHIEKLIEKFGSSGYGLYWYYLEQVYFSQSRMIPFNTNVVSIAAREMGVSKFKAGRVLKYLVLSDLLTIRGEYIYSKRAEHEVQDIVQAKERRREAAKRAGEASGKVRRARIND